MSIDTVWDLITTDTGAAPAQTPEDMAEVRAELALLADAMREGFARLDRAINGRTNV